MDPTDTNPPPETEKNLGGRPRSPLSLKQRRHLQYVAKKRAASGLPPVDETAAPEPPTGEYNLAAYVAEMDQAAKFAQNSGNPAAYVRALECKAKALGLLEEKADQAARYSLIIHTEVREDALQGP